MTNAAPNPSAITAPLQDTKRKHRILLFMFDFELSGVVVNVVQLANALDADGNDVAILVSRRSGREHHKLNDGIRVFVEPGLARPGFSRGASLLLAIPAIRRRLRTHRPDIFLSAGNHGHLPALIASCGSGDLQRVVRISNDPDHHGDSDVRRLVRGLLLRLVASFADRLLLVSPRLRSHGVLAAACEAGKVIVTPNGVAADKVRRLAAEPCEHAWAGCADPLVVAIGRLTRQKNLATLLKAVALANKVRPVRLLIVGRGDADARLRLSCLADRLGIGDRVDLVGERTSPFPYLSAASVFVLPSLWEGRSNVLLEAMACGVPIVASRTAGDAEELLDHGRFGVLVDPMDAEAMAEAILLQVGPDAFGPENRAEAFDQRSALARTCAASIGILSAIK